MFLTVNFGRKPGVAGVRRRRVRSIVFFRVFSRVPIYRDFALNRRLGAVFGRFAAEWRHPRNRRAAFCMRFYVLLCPWGA